MLLYRRPNIPGYLLLISLALSACGPVTPIARPLASATTPPKAGPALPTAAPIDTGLERITPENVDRLEQIDRWGVGYLKDFAVSPDQSKFALYVNQEIRVYDSETLTLRETIPARVHTSKNDFRRPSWKTLAFAPDGKTILFSNNAGIQIWDLAANESIDWFASLIPGWQVVNLELSPDGERMVLTTMGSSYRCDGRDSNLALYDLQGNLLFDRYQCADYVTTSYRFTSDGKVLFLVSAFEGSVPPYLAYLVDIQTGGIIESSQAVFDGYELKSRELFYDSSPDGKILAYATYGAETPVTKLVDSKTKRVIQTTNGYIEFFLEDGKASWRPRELGPSQPEKVVLGECGLENTRTPDDYRLVASNKASAVLLLSHFGRMERVELWDLATCQVSKTLSFPAAKETTFSPDGRWLLASDGYNAYVWEVRTGKLHIKIPGVPFAGPMDTFQFNADGTQVFTSSTGRDNVYPDQMHRTYTLSIYDAGTGRLIRQIEPDTEFLYELAATPNREIILAKDSAGFHFWNIETGRLLSNIPGGVYVFHPNDHELWVAPQKQDDNQVSRTIMLFDYKTGQVVRELAPVHTPWIRSLYLDRGSQKILAHLYLGVGKDLGNAVSILDVGTGAELLNYHLPWDGYQMTAYGDLFATAGSMGYVHLWKYDRDTSGLILLGTRTNRAVNDRYNDTFEYRDSVNPRLFDERLLLTTAGSIRFWDTTSGALLTELSPDYSIAHIAFSPDKSLIAVSGEDGLIRLWAVRKP